ncbi:hypothetical protein M758_7G106600 [Ceratodon purpureus]|nr:hypothetical protein M758_7G106600 [Ceratodon purpureus]
MALTGSATQEDGGKLPMQEITAVLKLLGMFLTAMSPLLLLPLFAADAQGRRWVEGRTGLCIFGVGVSTILTFLIAVNWDLVAPYAETSFVGLHSVFNGSFTFNLIFESHPPCLVLVWESIPTVSTMPSKF